MPLVPAKAGTQGYELSVLSLLLWVPAFAGTNGLLAGEQSGDE
jgi:hypothetical protein